MKSSELTKTELELLKDLVRVKIFDLESDYPDASTYLDELRLLLLKLKHIKIEDNE